MTALRYFLRFAGGSSAQHLPREPAPSDVWPKFEGAHVTLWHNSPDDFIPLPRGQGFVLGRLFHRDEHNRVIAPKDFDQVDASPFELITRRYWGSYLGCVTMPNGAIIWRDPTGEVPVYFSPIQQIFSSDADLIANCNPCGRSVDWSQLLRYICFKDLPSRRTALDGIDELLPGWMIDLGVSAKPRLTQYWSPWDHADKLSDSSAADIADRLWRTSHDAIGALGRSYQQCLVPVSGGLDSSVVLSELAGHDCDRRAITLFTDEAGGDERAYARNIARYTNTSLIQIRYDATQFDFSRSVTAHLPKPCGRIHERFLFDTVANACRQYGCDVVMTGNGGDNVFYNSRSIRPIFDCYWQRGISVELRNAFRDVAAITKTTSLNVLWHALKQAVRVHSSYRGHVDISFLSPAAKWDARKLEFTHPWLSNTDLRMPGKLGHVAMLLNMQSHVEGYLRDYDIPVVNPLVSQPIVELALAIPSWRMIEGGQDRAIVRQAFQRRLPTEILSRRRKGSPGSFALNVLLQNTGEVRERLLQGRLAKAGVLDLEAIAIALSKGPGMGKSYMRLLALLDMEAWLAAWSSN